MRQPSRIGTNARIPPALLILTAASAGWANPYDKPISPSTPFSSAISSPTPLLPLPPRAAGDGTDASPKAPAAVSAQANSGIDTMLIPGRTIQPIDLLSTLRLAGE